ncbi:MAG: transposase, partial [Chloroflexi bacterium]|nr:transposase [Chloroflexota bacterium]
REHGHLDGHDWSDEEFVAQWIERLEALCGDLFGLHLSPGAIAHALARTAQRLEGQAERNAEQVRASPVTGSDETSARVQGANWWQWVFQTPEASFHIIAFTRSGAMVREFLGQVQPPVGVSDLWKPQLGAGGPRYRGHGTGHRATAGRGSPLRSLCRHRPSLVAPELLRVHVRTR